MIFFFKSICQKYPQNLCIREKYLRSLIKTYIHKHEFIKALPLKATRAIFAEIPFLVTYCHTKIKIKQKPYAELDTVILNLSFHFL